MLDRLMSYTGYSWISLIILAAFMNPFQSYAADDRPGDGPNNKKVPVSNAVALQHDYQNAIKEVELDLKDMNGQLDWIRFQLLRIKNTPHSPPPKLVKTKNYLEKTIVSKQNELQRLKDSYILAKAQTEIPSSRQDDPFLEEALVDVPPAPIGIEMMNTDRTPLEKPSQMQKDNSVILPEGDRQPLALKSEIEQKLGEMNLNEWLDVHVKDGRLVLYLKWPIVFESDKISLSDHYLSFLENLAKFLTPYDKIKINLEGYSGSKQLGEETFSSKWELAVQRAIFVANHLIEKGVPSYVFNINSRGEKSNNYYNYTELDSASKRRVEMTIYF